MKLYEIPSEFGLLERALIDNEGELTPELEANLDELLRSGKDKIEGAAMVLRGMELEAGACREEARRIQQRASSMERSADRLKALVLHALDRAFGGKIKTPLFTVWGQTSAPTLSIDLAPGAELEKLPYRFIRVKCELAKDAVKDAFKKGDPLPEDLIVTEVPGTRYLRVK